MFALAWRNIWRKRWRSLFTAAAVALVVLLTTLNFGLGGAAVNGIYGSLTEGAGLLQVHVQDYRDLRSFGDLLIRDADAVQVAVGEALPDAEVVASLEVPGLLEGDGRSRGVLLTASRRPDTLRQAYAEDVLNEGTLPEPGNIKTVALGRGLADALSVQLGDTVYLYAPGTEGYGASAYVVSGLLEGTASQSAEVSLAAAQELAAPGAVSRFEVHLPGFNRLADDEALPALKARLQETLGDAYEVETWAEVNPSMAAYLGSVGPINLFISGIFFVLAGLVVANTVYLSIIERVREFGVIMALGAMRRKVVGMVLSESLLLCGVGALVGAAVGLGIVAYLAQGFSFPGQLGDLYAEQGLPRVLYASVNAGQILTLILFTFVTGIVAALFPAITAGRLEPVEAMRFAA